MEARGQGKLRTDLLHIVRPDKSERTRGKNDEVPRVRAGHLRRAGALDVACCRSRKTACPRRYRVRYIVRATCQELRTPGGSKEKREWEGCLAHCSARYTPRGQREEGDRETGGQRPCGQGRGAGLGEGGRADRGQDRARGPGQRGGSERERCLANCSASCSRWPGGRGSEMAGQGRGRATAACKRERGTGAKRCPTTERAARSARGH